MLRVDPELSESPFDKLTVLSNVEGLTAPSGSTSSPPRVLSRGKVEGRGFNAVEGSRRESGRKKPRPFLQTSWLSNGR